MEVVAKSIKPLNMQRAAEAVQAFAGSGAEWWMSPASLLEGETFYRQPRQADLVVWKQGEELGRWRLLPISYGSLVARHSQALKGSFAIPHASGYHYEEYDQLDDLKEQGQELMDALAPPINALWKRVYALDDTAGVPLSLAEIWWKQAEQVLENTWWSRLRELQIKVGPPDYLQHSSQLAEVLLQAQEGLKQIERFLTETPPPCVATEPGQNGELTPGDGSRYRTRHLVSPSVSSSGPFFTSSFDRNREGKWDSPENDDNESRPHSPVAQTDRLRSQLLEIRRRVDEVLGELDASEQ